MAIHHIESVDAVHSRGICFDKAPLVLGCFDFKPNYTAKRERERERVRELEHATLK